MQIQLTGEQKPLNRFVLVSLGWTFLVAGVLGLFLPLLPGSVLILLGSSLLSDRAPWFRRVVDRWRKRLGVANRVELAGEKPADPTAGTGPPKLLIFDEDVQHLTRCAESFEAHGLEVHKCTTIESALRCIEREEFDLALVDQVSPAFEGRRIIRHLARYSWPIPLIVLAERKNPECLRQALEVGAADYVEKPVSQQEIGTIIRHLLAHFNADPSGTGDSAQPDPKMRQGRLTNLVHAA